MRALLNAGILQPIRATGTRCLHCSLPLGRGCRCAVLPDDRRRPETGAQPVHDFLSPHLAGGTWTRSVA